MEPAVAAATAGPPVALVPEPTPPAGGWEARLTLSFARQGGRTVLARRAHTGPLVVQRTFRPEGPEVAHACVLHPPGGVVAGDRLHLDVTAQPGAHALLTTPAAGKFYRSGGAWAEQSVTLRVAADAVLEWLPQETIAFAGTRARLTTQVELAAGARHIGWEVLCLGRPAAGETFASGEVRQALAVHGAERLQLHERGRFRAGDALLDAPWGLAGYPVTGMLWCVGAPSGHARALTAHGLPQPRDGLGGITELEDVLLARCLTRHAEDARHWLEEIWVALRPAVCGRAACPPRIWRT